MALFASPFGVLLLICLLLALFHALCTLLDFCFVFASCFALRLWYSTCHAVRILLSFIGWEGGLRLSLPPPLIVN